MRKWLLTALMVGVLGASAPALAQYEFAILGDFPGLTIAQHVAEGTTPSTLTQSIQGATTFGLFLNEQDYIFEPAELGALKGWARSREIGNKWDPTERAPGGWFLLTNLGNMANQDTFQIGAWGQLGPGNLAVVGSFNRYKDQYTPSPYNMLGRARYAVDLDGDGTYDHILPFAEGEPPGDQTINGATDSRTETKNYDIYAAYGLLIGERSSVGLSLRHIQNDFTPEETADSSQSITSDYTYDSSGDLTERIDTTTFHESNAKDSRNRKSDTLAAEFKMWPSENLSFKVRAEYTKIKADLKFNSGIRDGFLVDTFDGFEALTQQYSVDDRPSNTADFTWDGHDWGLSGRVDWYMSAESALQVDLGYGQGSFSLKNKTPILQGNTFLADLLLDYGPPTGMISVSNTNAVSTSSVTLASRT